MINSYHDDLKKVTQAFINTAKRVQKLTLEESVTWQKFDEYLTTFERNLLSFRGILKDMDRDFIKRTSEKSPFEIKIRVTKDGYFELITNFPLLARKNRSDVYVKYLLNEAIETFKRETPDTPFYKTAAIVFQIHNQKKDPDNTSVYAFVDAIKGKIVPDDATGHLSQHFIGGPRGSDEITITVLPKQNLLDFLRIKLEGDVDEK